MKRSATPKGIKTITICPICLLRVSVGVPVTVKGQG